METKSWMMQGSSAMHSEGHSIDVPKNSPKKPVAFSMIKQKQKSTGLAKIVKSIVLNYPEFVKSFTRILFYGSYNQVNTWMSVNFMSCILFFSIFPNKTFID